MMMMMMNIKPANATETGFDEKAHFELFSTTVWQSTTVDHIVPVFSGDLNEEGYSEDDDGKDNDDTVNHVVQVFSDDDQDDNESFTASILKIIDSDDD